MVEYVFNVLFFALTKKSKVKTIGLPHAQYCHCATEGGMYALMY